MQGYITHCLYHGSWDLFAACLPSPPPPTCTGRTDSDPCTDPPFTQFAQTECQSTVLGLRNLMMLLDCVEVAQ